MTTRRVLVWLLSLSGLAVLGGETNAASAQSFPAARYIGYAPGAPPPFGIFDGIPNLSTHGTIQGVHGTPGASPPDEIQWVVTLTGAPDPSVLAGMDQMNNGASALGFLEYGMEVTGGSGATPVNVDVTASLFSTSYGDGGASASMQIQQVSGGTCSMQAPCPVPGAEWVADSISPKTPVSAKLSLDSNTIYIVALEAVANAPVNGSSNLVMTGGGRASVDPHFVIDSSTPNAANYALDFSPGIGNSLATPTTVPEPSSWVLLSLGFAGVGWLRFSRKGLRAPLTTSP